MHPQFGASSARQHCELPQLQDNLTGFEWLPGFAFQEIKGGLAAISLAKMPSAVLRCAVLRCAALCCAVLRCAVLRCAVLCRVLPRHAMPCYEPCQSFAFLHHADASFESATVTCAQLGVCEVWRCMVQTMPRMP